MRARTTDENGIEAVARTREEALANPYSTPEGEQMDFVEVMEIEDGLAKDEYQRA